MKSKLKDVLFIGIILFLVVTGAYAATYLYNADEVSYDNSNSNLLSTDIQNALDKLYTKCNSSTTTCPSGHTCTQKTNIKCKRATALHTETCINGDTSHYCQKDGYAQNDIIIYGNETTIEGVLTVGDAFDCDVNGDGTFDSTTERFYYVGDYYDTSNKAFNDMIAVLVYYSNTDDGVASITNVAYDSNAINWNGPITAITELPTTTQWSNIRLYKEVRQILTDNDKTSTNGRTLPSNFSYSGYSARLLTSQEIINGCYNYSEGFNIFFSLSKNCKFLFENTSYHDFSLVTDGSWLETPGGTSGLSTSYAWASSSRNLASVTTGNSFKHGARPVIEVLKSEILY